MKLFSETGDERLPVHRNTLDYFEEFVTTEILEKYKIILKSRWTYSFGIFFDDMDYKNPPAHMKPFDPFEKSLTVLPPNTFTKDAVKSYTVHFYIEKIKDNPQGPFIGFCEMMIDFIEVFFKTYFNKIKEPDFIEIRSKIDWDYLKSIKYPADKKDQDYFLFN